MAHGGPRLARADMAGAAPPPPPPARSRLGSPWLGLGLGLGLPLPRGGSRAARFARPRGRGRRGAGGGRAGALMHMHEASQEGAGPPGRRANGAAPAFGPHTKGARPAVTRGRARRGRPLAVGAGGLGLRGGVPRAPPGPRAAGCTWVAARRASLNRKCTPDLGWGLLCGPAGCLTGAPGCMGRGERPCTRHRGRVPVPPAAGTRTLGFAQALGPRPANPGVPYPLRARWPGYGLGSQFCKTPSVWLGWSPDVALRFALPGREGVNVKCGMVVQAGAVLTWAVARQNTMNALCPEVGALLSWTGPHPHPALS